MSNLTHLSWNAVLVLQYLTSRGGDHVYGQEVMKSLGFTSGLVYPVLRRLEEAGLLESYQEEIDERAAGRRARVMYAATTAGWEFAYSLRDQFAAAAGLADWEVALKREGA